MGWLKNFRIEMAARRAGRRHVQSQIGRAARDVTGPTGNAFSNAWEQLDRHGDAYMKSFDPRIPPSLFVSERDRTRMGSPMPLSERCIEDYGHATRRPEPDVDELREHLNPN